MSNPTAAIVAIGDELLSGRTHDTNVHHLAGELTRVAIDLKEARFVADEHDRIIEAVDALRQLYDYVFTCGGIGPTHDDITADAIAAAFGVGIGVRDDARAIMQERYDRLGIEMNEARLRMARIPDTADLIENVVSGAPGFRIGNVHVMAGVPSVFKAMLEAILPTLKTGKPILSDSVRIERAEGEIAGPLADLANRNPNVSIGSYPFHEGKLYGANIVVRGTEASDIKAVVEELKALFE